MKHVVIVVVAVSGVVGLLAWGGPRTVAAGAAPVVAQPASAAAEGWGTLKGRIIFQGDVPNLAALVRKGQTDARDAAVCAAQEVPDEIVVIDPQTKGVQNVFLYPTKKVTVVHPDLATSTEKELHFDQKGCRFTPRALVVRIDQTLLLKSSDPVAHNTNIQGPPGVGAANPVLPAGGKPIPFQFQRANRVPIQVACNIHPWMKGWLLPVDHPYAAVTAADGTFEIAKLPAGEIEFRVWQENAGYVNTTDGKVQKGLLKVLIESGKTTEVELLVDTNGLRLKP